MKGRVVLSSQKNRVLSDRYRMLAKIGEGGSGVVYRAHDMLLDVDVAVKFLASDLAMNGDILESLKHEARAAMQLSHPNIVRLHNLEKSGNDFYLVMELVDGQSLERNLSTNGPLDLATVADIVDLSADALRLAHRYHVLHTDIKPGNLLIDTQGVLKIVDFGTACLPGTQLEDSQWVAGTPPYMSPEQKRGDALDHRTDQYSLAMVAYVLLTGRTPYPKGYTNEQMLEEAPVDFPLPQPGVQAVLARALSIAPCDRWPDVVAFASAFRTAVQGG